LNFDYAGVPSHQRWMNSGKFDGGQLTNSEKALRDFHKRLFNFDVSSSALMDDFHEIQTVRRQLTLSFDVGIYTLVRWLDTQKLIVVTSFFELNIPADSLRKRELKDGDYAIKDQLCNKSLIQLRVVNGVGNVQIKIAPSESFIYQL
jgi:hypothetical protein